MYIMLIAGNAEELLYSLQENLSRKKLGGRLEHLKNLYIVIGLALAAALLAWTFDFLGVRGSGLLGLAFLVGASILGFLILEFENRLNSKNIRLSELVYAFAIAICYVMIVLAAPPDARLEARLFVLFLALPFLAIFVREHIKERISIC